MKHDFQQSLQKEAQFDELTKQVLSDYFAAETVTRLQSGNFPSQHAGLDYGVVLPTGRYISVDSKIDRHTSNRICIEAWSNVESRKPGWAMSGQLLCSYVAYILPNAKRAYFIPYEQLVRSVAANYNAWLAMCSANEHGCRIVRAQNKTYTSSSFGLSYEVVEQEFGKSALYVWE